jgi:hypothetical protein
VAKSELVKTVPVCFLATGLETNVISLTTSHLTKQDIANRARGYSNFLPETDEQCIVYYRYISGALLSTPVTLVQIQDQGVASVIPAALLASSVVEMHPAPHLKDILVSAALSALNQSNCFLMTSFAEVERAAPTFISAKSLKHHHQQQPQTKNICINSTIDESSQAASASKSLPMFEIEPDIFSGDHVALLTTNEDKLLNNAKTSNLTNKNSVASHKSTIPQTKTGKKRKGK